MTDRETYRISLGSDEFFLLWFAHHKVRHFPYFLGIGPVGRTRKDRAACTAFASEALHQRGLGTIENPAADLMQAVDVLATAPVRVELAYGGGAAPTLCLGAVQHSRAATVSRAGEEVRLRVNDASGLQPTLIDSVPPVEPGTGSLANVRTADFDEAAGAAGADGRRTPRDVLEEAGMRGNEIATVMEILEADARRGTLALKWREGTDDWRYSPSEVSWVDAVSGRYSLRRADGWTTIAPTDHARLSSMFTELLSETGG